MAKNCQSLAGAYVRRQAKLLASQLAGVRQAEEIEFIHQARVASRRLRTALRMFCGCFPANQIKPWRSEIQRVARKLGPARDRDVQIEFLCGILSEVTDKACSAGIARMLARLEHQRELLQPSVIAAADRLHGSEVLAKMQAVTKKMLTDDVGRRGGRKQKQCRRRRVRRSILRQLAGLWSQQESLHDPEDCQAHHAMRIAAKRLRYTVEIARPMYEGQLDSTLGTIKRLQTLLGEVHDCDVWLEHLDTFGKQERRRLQVLFGHPGRFLRLQPGIEYVRLNRLHHRRAMFQELIAYWEVACQQGVWEHLRAVLSGRAAAAKGPERLPSDVGGLSGAPPVANLGAHARPAGRRNAAGRMGTPDTASNDLPPVPPPNGHSSGAAHPPGVAGL